MPMTMAMKNGNVAMKMDQLPLEGKTIPVEVRMVYLKDKNKTYMVVSDFFVVDTGEEGMNIGAEMDFSAMFESLSDVDTSKIQKSKETLNNKQMDVETITDADGSTIKFYFDNGVLKRIQPSGEAAVDFRSFSTSVDDSLFSTTGMVIKMDKLESALSRFG